MNQRLIYRLRNAYMWYKNLDKFMKYLNAADVGLNLFYSTPSCYLKSKHEDFTKPSIFCIVWAIQYGLYSILRSLFSIWYNVTYSILYRLHRIRERPYCMVLTLYRIYFK